MTLRRAPPLPPKAAPEEPAFTIPKLRPVVPAARPSGPAPVPRRTFGSPPVPGVPPTPPTPSVPAAPPPSATPPVPDPPEEAPKPIARVPPPAIRAPAPSVSAPAPDPPEESSQKPVARIPPPAVRPPVPAAPAPKKVVVEDAPVESEPEPESPKVEPPKPVVRPSIPAPVPKKEESESTDVVPPLSPPVARPTSTSPVVGRPTSSPLGRTSNATIPTSIGVLGLNSNEGKYASKTLLEVPDLKSLPAFEVAKAFVRSEEAYLKIALQCVTVEFENRLMAHIKLGRPILTQEEVVQLFGNIDNIFDFNKQLFSELEELEAGGEEKLLGGLGTTMKKFIPFFKLYQKYVENRESAFLFNEWMKNREKFRYEVELNEMCTGQKLRNLLSAPVTRLAQYLIFLGSVHEKLSPSNSGYQTLEEAIRSIQNVTDTIAQKVKDSKARKMCVKVQTETFKGANLDLLSPTRFVHKIGDLQLMGEKLFGKGKGLKAHTFVIFNDCFVYGTKYAGVVNPGKAKGVCRLEGLSVKEVPDDTKNGITNAFEINHPHIGTLLVCAQSVEDRTKWIGTVEKAVTDFQFQKQSSGLQASQQSLTDDEFEFLITKKKIKPSTGTFKASTFSSLRASSPLPDTTSGAGSSSTAPHAPSLAPAPAAGGAPGGKWQKILDPASGCYYYENEAGDSSWEPPPGWVDSPADSSGGGGGDIPDAPPSDAPEAPPMDAPEAPPMDAPDAPEMDGPSSGGAVSGPPPPKSAGSSSGVTDGKSDLLSSIRAAGGVGALKSVKSAPPRAAPPPKAGAGPPPKADLQATLQTSLANYRQFVQADDDEGGEEDDGGDWE